MFLQKLSYHGIYGKVTYITSLYWKRHKNCNSVEDPGILKKEHLDYDYEYDWKEILEKEQMEKQEKEEEEESEVEEMVLVED